jgi:hypothetical protein
MEEGFEREGPECTLLSRNRCFSGAPKVSEGRKFFFAEKSMTWEAVEALAASQSPGRVLCLAC